MKQLFRLMTVACVALSIVNCKKGGTVVVVGTPANHSVPVETTCFAEADRQIRWDGSIGNYEIVFNYNFADGTGYYNYVNSVTTSTFNLQTVRKQQTHKNGNGQWVYKLVVEEIAPSGAHTGTFDGEECDGVYQGVFTNYKGKQFDFRLTASY